MQQWSNEHHPPNVWVLKQMKLMDVALARFPWYRHMVVLREATTLTDGECLYLRHKNQRGDLHDDTSPQLLDPEPATEGVNGDTLKHQFLCGHHVKTATPFALILKQIVIEWVAEWANSENVSDKWIIFFKIFKTLTR